MGDISQNFSYSEFEHSDTAKQYGIANYIPNEQVRRSIEALVVKVLQPLRTEWGRSLHINSGYRCQRLNELVGGVPTSQHTKGEAADIKCSTPRALAALAESMNLPFDQMILYPTFVHFSHKLEGEQRHQILYNQSYNGPKL